MELLVYSASWCPDSRTAKLFLDKNNVPYTDIDIESTPAPPTKSFATPANALSRSS
jgi:glutaredoxin